MLAPKPTITARIKFMGDLPTVVGKRSVEMDVSAGQTVRDLLRLLSDTYGEAFTSRVFSGPDKLHHYILVFVDGENIKGHGGLDAALGKGEVDVVMLPMFGGG